MGDRASAPQQYPSPSAKPVRVRELVSDDTLKLSVGKPFDEIWVVEKDVRSLRSIEHRHILDPRGGYHRWDLAHSLAAK